MTYAVAKRADGWHVVDSDGYDVSYVSYDTKGEAKDSARIYHREYADARYRAEQATAQRLAREALRVHGVRLP